MSRDPDELEQEDLERRTDPKRVGDLLEHIDWRMQYGEYAGPVGWKFLAVVMVILQSLILWRLW